MNTVILLGTNHELQRTDSKELQEYIEQLIVNYDIKAIGEEIDDEKVYIIQKIAEEKNIVHIIIEPTLEERNKLGIKSEIEIRKEVGKKYKYNGLPNSNWSTDAIQKIEEQEQITYRLREKEWLNRIKKLNLYPILVVCGASHYEPFQILLKSSGFKVINECSDWTI